MGTIGEMCDEKADGHNGYKDNNEYNNKRRL